MSDKEEMAQTVEAMRLRAEWLELGILDKQDQQQVKGAVITFVAASTPVQLAELVRTMANLIKLEFCSKE